MRINHNITALNTYRQLSGNTAAQGKSIEKLSSGLRINRAGDDAAGLAISEKMRGQIRGLDMAARNAQDGISMIQTAEGALNETHSILQRMRELAVQSSNDTNTEVDRGEIQKEIDQLVEEIDRISSTTEFNTQKLLDGSRGLTTAFSNTGGDNGDFTGLSFSKAKNLTDGQQTISITHTAAQAASSFSTQNMTANGGNSATGNLTVDGTYTGSANGTVTVSYAGSTEFSTDNMTANGGNNASTTGNVTVDGTYTGSEATLTVSYTAAVLQQEAAGTIGDINLSATNGGAYEGSTGNLNIQIVSSSGATVGAAVSGGTLTITLDSDNAMNAAAIDAALLAGGLDGDFSATGGTNLIGNETGSLTGGQDAEAAKFEVTDAANGTQDVTAGAYQGLTIDTSGLAGATPNNGDSWTISLANNTTTWTVGDGTTTENFTGDTASFAGLTFDKSGISGEVDGDAWTVSVTAAVAEKNEASLNGGTAVEITTGGGAVKLTNGTESATVDFGTFSISANKSITVDTATTDNSASIHIGANSGQNMSVDISDMSSSALDVDAIDVTTKAGADAAITTIQSAIESVSAERSKLGAFQNRLDHTINNLGTSSENLTAAESRVRDVDMAKEMMEQTKNSILAQAAQAMLAQANQQPQGVLQLLR